MIVLLAAPLLLTLTLLVSGLAKLGARQGTEEAMTSLRLPLRGLHRTVATVLPVTEIVLALVLWVPSVPVQTAVAVVIALLMIAYLGIITRALTFEEPVECSCFGTLASPTVSRLTLGRNLLLTGLSLLSVVAAAGGSMTTVLVQAPLSLIGLGITVLLTIALTILTVGSTDPAARPSPAAAGAGSSSADSGAAGAHGAEDEELLDYERAATPAAVLQKPDGRLITLSQLTAQRAALLVFTSEGCGPCERVLDRAPEWIASLSPSLQVRFVFSRPVDQLRERTLQRVGELAMHDLQFTARSTLGGRTAPSAVLLGADGLLAGGPVDGGSTVIEFVEEIRTQLRDAQDQDQDQPPSSAP
ncbi:hypothetical protein CFK38_01395 [Brachybacterium vulturis]|uniref:Methylamine utilisation protein MauE domain-containing protein n=1 Tax=Brachybacterium vulturis TaxID=2017484 RepID=A0A291GJF2_9MICO|nr:MauE/DoxX family redox-associated membrane protein [Brachybacterium vulturis]ATG50325.1 hypothetical protein CFK38_01395 [Brachybacterium vulturis]